jgi:Ca-activated chloride channel family protein
MTFLSAARLWLLLGVVALAVAYVLVQTRRSAYTVRFTNLELLGTVAPKRPGWRRHAVAGVFLASITVFVLAFAQPARDEQVPRERATVIMAIDTSLSMEATDVAPNRLEAAQLAALDFVEVLPDKINLGLVTFNGNAVVRVPPSTDREPVIRAIENLELGEATAIGEAIFTSLDAIDSVPPDEEGTQPPARIVLMSDGETTVGRPNEVAVDAALEADVPVSTIAFGTDSGTIEVPESGTIPVPVNGEALGEIAEQTGGTAFTAETADELTAVYEDIGTSVGFETEEVEITSVFVGLGLVLMMATAGLSLVWFNRLP